MNRSRELTVQLIELKRSLSANLAKLEEKNIQAKEELTEAQAQLNRADIFTQRHSYSVTPSCPKCFIFQNQLTAMNLSPSSQSGAQVFKCVCGHELTIETDSNL